MEDEKEIIDYTSWQLAKDIFVLLKPYRARFYFASVLEIIGDLIGLYPVFAFASIITFLTKYQSGQSLNQIWIISGLWISSTIIGGLLLFFSGYIGSKIAERVGIDSTLKAIQHLFRLDMQWHELENSGNKIKM